VNPLRCPVKDAAGDSAHRFAFARAAARVNAYDDLPRARHPRSHASVTMRLTDLCLPLCLPEPVPVLSVPDLASSGSAFLRPSGAIGGSVVSRRAGPASVGHAATRRVVRPREPHRVSPWCRRSWSRSVRDFTSDISSPAGSPFRLRRTAWVMTDGSRSLLPPPVKVTASHDPRRLPPHRHRDSLAAAPPPCLATPARLSTTC